MTGLALLLLVKEATGSYARAGAVSACYSVALAIVAPFRARAADRRGPTPVLRLCAALQPLAFALVVALAALDAPVLLDALGAVLIGATLPPIGGVMRALWGQVLEPKLLPVAYSLDAVLVEVCFVTGPLTVALVAAVFSPSVAVLVSAVFGCAGALVLAGVPVVQATQPEPARPTHFAGPLVSPVVRAALLCVLFIGCSFGAIEVGVLAFVEEQGHARSIAGAVLAVWAAGSALGGLAYAAVRVRADASRQLPFLVVIAGAATALPLLAPNTGLLAVLLLLSGSTIAPWNGVNSVVVGQAAPAGTTTEAFAWFGTLIFAGGAAGTALSGVLADAHGATGAFVVSAGSGVLAMLAAALAVRVIKTQQTEPGRVAL
jgi:MFS family permease